MFIVLVIVLGLVLNLSLMICIILVFVIFLNKLFIFHFLGEIFQEMKNQLRIKIGRYLLIQQNEIKYWQGNINKLKTPTPRSCMYVCVCVFTGIRTDQHDWIMRRWITTSVRDRSSLSTLPLIITTFILPPFPTCLIWVLGSFIYPLLPPPISSGRRRRTSQLHPLPTSFHVL